MSQPKHGFTVTKFGDVANEPPPSWLLSEFMQRASINTVFGPSNVGKSLFLNHITHAMGGGMGGEWFSSTSEDGRENWIQDAYNVIYISTEAMSSANVKATRKAYPPENWCFIDPCRVTGDLDLMSDDAHRRLRLLVEEVESENDHAVGAIILDIWRDGFSGLEDSSGDVAKALRPLKKLRDELGISFIISCHTGHAGDHERGSSHLRANVDAAWQVSEKNGVHTVTCKKMRNAAKPEPFSFEKVIDENGGCYIKLIPGTTTATSKRPLNGQKRLAYESLQDMTAERGEPLPAALGLPAGLYGLPCDVWRQAMYERLGDKPQDTKRKAFDRALTDLQNSGHVGVRGDLVWPVL